LQRFERLADFLFHIPGPANLAVSIALREEAEKRGETLSNAVWLEKSANFAW
jgi:lysine/ornithine N-monooxygenase